MQKGGKEGKTNRAVIRYWYNYAEKFKERIREIIEKDVLLAEKTVITQIYDEIGKEIPEWTRENLKKKTEGVRKIYYLFSKVGKEKIRKLKETSMNTILQGKWEEIYELEREYFRREAEEDNNRFRENMEIGEC